MNIKWLTKPNSDYSVEILCRAGEAVGTEQEMAHIENTDYVLVINDYIKELFERSNKYFLHIGVDLDTNRLIFDLETQKGIRIREPIYPYQVKTMIDDEELLSKLLPIVGDKRKIYFEFSKHEQRFISECL
ncbi:hypothetical protein [Desertibacillus haloalkaliphilus]|uniref:hypothetical protein n=1 Tax=Desertibacillus haloalkaliphilus TaxID=1328930 RepID=UPI001C26A0BB|nr:hypothetical protein [Desertibacillus haloalkaliphilus]MBU8905940.1 hypothetical protein [Desertibacillus haloalkaliphilus]